MNFSGWVHPLVVLLVIRDPLTLMLMGVTGLSRERLVVVAEDEEGTVISTSVSVPISVAASGAAAVLVSKNPDVENSAQSAPGTDKEVVFTDGKVEGAGSVTGLVCREMEGLEGLDGEAMGSDTDRLPFAAGFFGIKRLKGGNKGSLLESCIGKRERRRMVSSAKIWLSGGYPPGEGLV